MVLDWPPVYMSYTKYFENCISHPFQSFTGYASFAGSARSFLVDVAIFLPEKLVVEQPLLAPPVGDEGFAARDRIQGIGREAKLCGLIYTPINMR